MSESPVHDVLILGSGAAGLALALRLAPKLDVALVSKGDLTEGSTLHAQGGISAVLGHDDSLQSHIDDTIAAGDGLCRREVVDLVVRRAPDAIRWLEEQGVAFTRETGPDGRDEFHLTREGGHSHRRVVHAADATGRALETTLATRVRDTPSLTRYEHHIAVDLISGRKFALPTERCVGAYLLDRATDVIRAVRARCVVLATGGASRVYLYSSNPDGSTGDGIAMAWRAGCRVANLEFIQFHPTCLFHPRAKSFLVSEAVRGEGGRLLLPDGTPFMSRFDPRGELAPRDIVARAIDHEMKRLGIESVFLDISHRGAEFIREHFPNIHERCLSFGFDMTRGPIPVVPAAHYTCGGILADTRGRTDVAGLWAIGEVACTGLHGANRMASNSLLECLVFAERAAEDILAGIGRVSAPPEVPPWDASRVTDSDEEVVVAHNWEELRRFMWDYVGIVRTDKRLERARHRVDLLRSEIADFYGHFHVTNDLVELRNLALVAELIIRCAQARRESRGLHYTLDFPGHDASRPPQDTVLVPAPGRSRTG